MRSVMTSNTPPPTKRSLSRFGLMGPGKLAGFEKFGDGGIIPADPMGGGGELGTGPGREN